jgi:hypothetical protein
MSSEDIPAQFANEESSVEQSENEEKVETSPLEENDPLDEATRQEPTPAQPLGTPGEFDLTESNNLRRSLEDPLTFELFVRALLPLKLRIVSDKRLDKPCAHCM